MVRVEDALFLMDLARDTVQAARVAPGQSCGLWVNISGGPLIKVSVSSSMPAWGTADFALSVDAGLFTREEERHALMALAGTQANREILLPAGGRIPCGAVADHLMCDGTPVFFPGGSRTGESGGLWGTRPPFDTPFHFIHLAWRHVQRTGDYALLHHAAAGHALVDRLDRAFHATPADPDTGLVTCEESDRGANVFFMNTVVQTGALLFASLLRARAAQEMKALMLWAGDEARAFCYQCERARLDGRFDEVFGHEDGLLRAATGTSGQPDVWGTAFAVAHGFLSPTVERRACAALARGCRDADLAWKGQIRQVPPQADVNPGQPWERLIQPAPEASAQNGAYSAMATGWVCDAVYRADPDLAGRLVQQLVNHFREEDFRNGESSGAPWGWAHPRGDYRNERGYLAAMTGPLISFFRNGWMSASEEMTE